MRNIIVTGASRGLGLAIAGTLRLAGYHIVAIARSESAELTEERGRDGAPGALSFMPCDLAELAAIPDLVARIRREFGPIFGLVNNAASGANGVLAMMPDGDIEELVRLNTISPLILSKYAARSMMARSEGRIVSIASIVGFSGYRGLAAYSATKAALIGFTRSFAREVGTLGITVNAVAPGFIDTAMTRSLGDEQRDQIARRSALQRLSEARDVADAVEFLISDKARNITGTVLTVDAGGTA